MHLPDYKLTTLAIILCNFRKVSDWRGRTKICVWRLTELTLDGRGRVNLNRETKFTSANGDREKMFFLFSWPRAGLATIPPVDTQSATTYL